MGRFRGKSSNNARHFRREGDLCLGEVDAIVRIPVVVNAKHRISKWTHIAAVEVDHDAQTATAYAIADNRTSDLSEFDYNLLAELLREVEDHSPKLFEDLLLYSFMAQPAEEEEEPEQVKPPTSAYQVIVVCQDTSDREKLLKRLRKEGRECHAVTWSGRGPD